MDDRGKTARSRGVVAAICGIALAGGIATSAAGAAGEYEFGDQLPADAAFAPGVSLDKDSAGAEAGLSTRLAELTRAGLRRKSDKAQADAVGLAPSGAGSLLRDGDRLVVNVRVSSTSADVLAAIRASGAEIVSVNAPYGTVDVSVPPADLRALAAADGVEYVAENLVPMSASGDLPSLDRGAAGSVAKKKTCRGKATAEGDVQSGTADARKRYGMDGYGQKIGIISDSFDTGQNSITSAKQDIKSGDLPGRKNPCGYTAKVQVLSEGAPTDIDEGRGMAQLVHDMAPAARLAFASRGASEDDMAGAVRALANAGSTVITDDITFFSEPFFQEGPIANAVTEVTQRGIPYFSSAANSNVIVGGRSVGSYEAPSFRPAGACLTSFGLSGQCMDFNPGAPNDVIYGLALAPGTSFNLIMQWAEPRFGVSTDLDILFFDETSGTFQDASGTNNIQSQLPLEVLNVSNPYPFTAIFDVVVYRASGAGTPRLKFTFGRSQLADVEYPVGLGSDVVGPTIMGHNGGLNTISTGAISYDQTAEPESFSSQGPVVNYFAPVNGTTPAAPLASPQVLIKPDITATDNVQTTFFLPSDNDVPRFSGTSAAAPAAAAVAALQRQANPSLNPAQVLAAERATAAPIGAFGPLAVGAGLINAGRAVGVNPPVRPNTKITKKPGKTIHKSSASFKFESDVPGVRFQCGLGKRPKFRQCSKSVRVVGIKRGAKTTFQVRAVNGKTKDKSPAKFSFRRR